jgi:signal transduction histidine kinase
VKRDPANRFRHPQRQQPIRKHSNTARRIDGAGLPSMRRVPESLERFSKQVELAVFCIVLEALANVHRHANTRSATIRIVRTPQRVTTQISDNGVGMAMFSSQRPASLSSVSVSQECASA